MSVVQKMKKSLLWTAAEFSACRVRDPDACIEVSDPRGSHRMDMQACPPGPLPAGINESEEMKL